MRNDQGEWKGGRKEEMRKVGRKEKRKERQERRNRALP